MFWGVDLECRLKGRMGVFRLDRHHCNHFKLNWKCVAILPNGGSENKINLKKHVFFCIFHETIMEVDGFSEMAQNILQTRLYVLALYSVNWDKNTRNSSIKCSIQPQSERQHRRFRVH